MALVAPYLRWWDVRTCDRVHYFIGNSQNVAERIVRIYHRPADVIYPPVSTELFQVSVNNEGYYLVVSALVPYKRVDLAIKACNASGDRLLVVGSGPEREKLERMAKNNIEFLGWQSDDDLVKLYAGCRALIFPGVEDFGIVPLEAMASGKPVLAYAKGGALETVIGAGENQTGVFFHEQTVESVLKGMKELSQLDLDPYVIRGQTARFDRAEFKKQMQVYIDTKLSSQGRSPVQERTRSKL
jgi:glycosyltransferase involved in cell wall biosynthesis